MNKIALNIGCCGAYCKTCPALADKVCKGCKLGYSAEERDISKIKCEFKACCFRERKLDTCADCSDYPQCRKIQNFYQRNGYKYKKYKESIEFIRENGYEKFLSVAGIWKGPYGKLD